MLVVGAPTEDKDPDELTFTNIDYLDGLSQADRVVPSGTRTLTAAVHSILADFC